MAMDTKEMQRGINFWMAVECLCPNSVPEPEEKLNKRTITWEINRDEELPWNDAEKIFQMSEYKSKILQSESENHRRSAPPELSWAYLVYFPLIDMSAVIGAICKILTVSKNLEMEYRKKAKPSAALGIALDSGGFFTGELFVSSVPWAMGVISAKNSQVLDFSNFFGSDPEKIQQILTNEIMKLAESQLNILAKNADNAVPAKPITLADLEVISNLLFARCDWSPEKTLPLRIQAKLSQAGTESDNEPQLLNSFYVEDLHQVFQAIGKGDTGAAFTTYMGAGDSSTKVDIRQNEATVLSGLMPQNIPLTRWPSAYGLFRGQQFAVNTAVKRLAGNRGLFSVNGPPGTGKTTLLRDIIASVIVDRAIVMASYKKPSDALKNKLVITNEKYLWAYKVDPDLCGNGIVVASSNNGAVENITSELPSFEAVPEEFPFRYFSEMSDSIAAPNDTISPQTWGLIAAVLGRKRNRTKFFERLCRGGAEDRERRLRSLWEIVEERKATKPWDEAKAKFNEALEKAKANQMRMQSIAEAANRLQEILTLLPQLEPQVLPLTQAVEELKRAKSSLHAKTVEQASSVAETKKVLENAEVTADKARNLQQELSRLHAVARDIDNRLRNAKGKEERISTLENKLLRSTDELFQANEFLKSFGNSKPGFWAWIFKRKEAKTWERNHVAAQEDFVTRRDAERALYRELEEAKKFRDNVFEIETAKQENASVLDVKNATLAQLPAFPDEEVRKAAQQHNIATADLLTLKKEMETLDGKLATQMAELGDLKKRIVTLRDDLANANLNLQGIETDLVDKWLCKGMSEDAIQLSVPWEDKAFADTRQELFCAALELHESFILNSWPRLKTALKALALMNKGKILPNQVVGGADQLWEAFFLVVPVISTTFASFSRMFKGCGRESLGWLLIDEAGQSTPQQAVGAIWRSKRAVVVGDPLQLEPIVGLPGEALETLRKRCQADELYNQSKSSAQVLSDRSNSIGTEIPGDDSDEARWVGCPLRVHRRCLETMFKISNRIAYKGMMVYGTPPQKNDFWPESCWIHISADAGTPSGHCIPSQVDKAIRLVKDIARDMGGLKSGKNFNAYVITPFKDVDDSLDVHLYKLFREEKKGMHGTVHTFQGKEADIVIFVLGGHPDKEGVITDFAAAKPNLLNVAVTRAKKRLYVIGDHNRWGHHSYFRDMKLPLLESSDFNFS